MRHPPALRSRDDKVRYARNMPPINTLLCWAISDTAAGNVRQARALADAIGQTTRRDVAVRVRQPWDALAPHLTAGARSAIRDSAGQSLAPPWPDIAIGCGRRAALLTRLLRRWSGGSTFTVQILDPRIDPSAFDMVIAPQHDGVDASNVIRSIGALNPVDAHWLADARTRFARLAALPSPRTAVLIGATNRAQRLDGRYFDALLDRLRAERAADGGSFLVSVSRRTPSDVVSRLRAAFAPFPSSFWAEERDGENPYAGFLAWSDRIVVTPDSVNMLSEACATGKPAYTFAPQPIAGKLAAFHHALRESGHLRVLGESAPNPLPPPLAETREIAALVRARWLAASR